MWQIYTSHCYLNKTLQKQSKLNTIVIQSNYSCWYEIPTQTTIYICFCTDEKNSEDDGVATATSKLQSQTEDEVRKNETHLSRLQIKIFKITENSATFFSNI